MGSGQRRKAKRKAWRIALQQNAQGSVSADPVGSGGGNLMQAGSDEHQNSLRKVIAGGLFALFFALIVGALTVFAVTNMVIGHLLMAAAAAVGTLLIWTEAIPSRPPQHKIAYSILLCLLVGFADFAIVRSKRSDIIAPEAAHLGSSKFTGTALSIVLSSQPDFHPISDTVQGLSWSHSYVYTTVTINNTSDFDLRNVHMSLETDHTFAKIIQLTNIPASLHPGCNTPSVSSTWRTASGPDTRQVDELGVAGVDNSGLFLTNAYDAYLDTFPAHDHVTFLLAAMGLDMSPGSGLSYDQHGGIKGKAIEIEVARVSGSYAAPLSPDKAELTSYRYDIYSNKRPYKFSLIATQVPDSKLQRLNQHVVAFSMPCPSKPTE